MFAIMVIIIIYLYLFNIKLFINFYRLGGTCLWVNKTLLGYRCICRKGFHGHRCDKKDVVRRGFFRRLY